MPTRHLNLQPNFGIPGERQRHAYAAGDAFFERLVAAHDGLDAAQSQALNARLLLLLANHIGDLRVLDEAVALACRGSAVELEGEPSQARRGPAGLLAGTPPPEAPSAPCTAATSATTT